MKTIINLFILFLITNSLFSQKVGEAQFLRYFKDLFLKHDWSSVTGREKYVQKKVTPVKIFLHGNWSPKNRVSFKEASYEFEKLLDLNHTLVTSYDQSNLCVTNDYSFSTSVIRDYENFFYSGSQFDPYSSICYRVQIDIVRCDYKINKTLIYINPNLFQKDYLISRLSNIALARNIGYSGSSREFSRRFPKSIFSGAIDVYDNKTLSNLDKSFIKLLYQNDIPPSKTKFYSMDRETVFKAIKHFNLLDKVR